MIIRDKFMVIRAKVKLSQYQVFCFQIRLKATNVEKYKKERITFGVVRSFVFVR